jgi:hypothetical protein
MKGTWWDQILDKRFRNINTETGIRRRVECENKEQRQNIRINMIKYEEKWERKVRKKETEV